VVILGNDAGRGDLPGAGGFVLGDTGVPWQWEYGAAKAFVE
jgi:hypothetical protein